MKKTFLVKKDPNRPGTDENWIIMNSYEFALFMKTDEGKRRRKHFGQMNAVDEKDSIIIMECDLKTATEMREEVNREAYARKKWKESGFLVFSLDAKRNTEDRSCEETELIDENINIEMEVLRKIEIQMLADALGELSDSDMDIIYKLYLSDNPISEYQYSEETGIPRTTIISRKQKILSLLTNKLEKPDKKQG